MGPILFLVYINDFSESIKHSTLRLFTDDSIIYIKQYEVKKTYTNYKSPIQLCRLQKKGALDSQLQVIKFTSCLPRVGGSLRVLGFPPPLKTGSHDIVEILLKVALKPN